MQVTPNVRAVQVPDDSPMHPIYTTIYLVGKGQVLTIDSGEDMERYRWMLRGYLAATEKAEIALSAITHHHGDHSANLRWLRDLFGAEVYVHGLGKPLLTDRLPDTGVHVLADGNTLEVGGAVKLQVLHTPGHSIDSVCYYFEDEGVLFSGDTLLGSTPTTVNDLSDYVASLARLRTLPNLRIICPGHGPLIDNPAAYIDGYIRHRNEREQQIVDVLSQGEATTSWEIMLKIYTEIDSRLRRAADSNVRSHLRKLEKEGRVIVHPGTPRAKAPGVAAKEAEEEHARLEVIRKADEYREADSKRAVFLQENPPSDEWEEPPRYELG